MTNFLSWSFCPRDPGTFDEAGQDVGFHLSKLNIQIDVADFLASKGPFYGPVTSRRDKGQRTN